MRFHNPVTSHRHPKRPWSPVMFQTHGWSNFWIKSS